MWVCAIYTVAWAAAGRPRCMQAWFIFCMLIWHYLAGAICSGTANTDLSKFVIQNLVFQTWLIMTKNLLVWVLISDTQMFLTMLYSSAGFLINWAMSSKTDLKWNWKSFSEMRQGSSRTNSCANCCQCIQQSNNVAPLANTLENYD